MLFGYFSKKCAASFKLLEAPSASSTSTYSSARSHTASLKACEPLEQAWWKSPCHKLPAEVVSTGIGGMMTSRTLVHGARNSRTP